MTLVEIWRGDITKLKIEAIVNAANPTALGCFTPGHTCIDNVIHKAAGPGLHEECKGLGGLQVGQAKLTKAYKLPSKYVIHTLGPNASEKDGKEDFDKLALCYASCLEVCRENKIREVAFCCVSTGLYGHRNEQSAAVALCAVSKWLKKDGMHIDKVVFDVFTDTDERYYREYFPYYFGDKKKG